MWIYSWTVSDSELWPTSGLFHPTPYEAFNVILSPCTHTFVLPHLRHIITWNKKKKEASESPGRAQERRSHPTETKRRREDEITSDFAHDRCISKQCASAFSPTARHFKYVIFYLCLTQTKPQPFHNINDSPNVIICLNSISSKVQRVMCHALSTSAFFFFSGLIYYIFLHSLPTSEHKYLRLLPLTFPNRILKFECIWGELSIVFILCHKSGHKPCRPPDNLILAEILKIINEQALVQQLLTPATLTEP